MKFKRQSKFERQSKSLTVSMLVMVCNWARMSLTVKSAADMVGSSSFRRAATTQAEAIMLGEHMANLYSRAHRAM